MNITKRLLLALLSTSCLAVGLVRAADRLDPVNRDLEHKAPETVTSTVDCITGCSAVDCITECQFADNDQ